jgi:hypothetical protein
LTLDVATYLEEYLEVWRPKLPNAAKDRHVFLSKRGRPFTDTTLRNRLRINVYRYTKKHLYTHLLRTIFTSQALSDGEDINTVAYGHTWPGPTPLGKSRRSISNAGGVDVTQGCPRSLRPSNAVCKTAFLT